MEIAQLNGTSSVDDKEADNEEDGKVGCSSKEELGNSNVVVDDDEVIDISVENREFSLLNSSELVNQLNADLVKGYYIYDNVFSMIPRSIDGFTDLKKLKFFSNEINIFPPETGNLVGLECLQVKFSSPGVGSLPLQSLKALKELELCRVPPRASAFGFLSEISNLKRLTKLSICHFSIRFLPPDIGCLKNLEDLDLSFNKLKSLPDDIGDLSALKSLRVASNKLVELPTGLSCLQMLKDLDLSHNRLTSLGDVKLYSMQTLRNLNLQYNKLLNCCQIPSWICCNLEGNRKDAAFSEVVCSSIEVDVSDLAVQKEEGNRSCNGSHCISQSLLSDSASSSRCIAVRRMRKGWKRRDYLQQKARQERLNTSRKWRVEEYHELMSVKMAAKCKRCKHPVVGSRACSLQCHVNERNQLYCDSGSGSPVKDLPSGKQEVAAETDCKIILLKMAENDIIDPYDGSHGDDCSCITFYPDDLKECDDESDGGHDASSAVSLHEIDEPADETSAEPHTNILKPKRHSDGDLDNPKPRKFRRPVSEGSKSSFKYNSESFCSIDDCLPDGFYDAGRDRPFMTLQDYEQTLSLDSREVILVDRERDEELDAIAFSAQVLVSGLKHSRYLAEEKKSCTVDDSQRASVLALFVSDCFGGSYTNVLRMRKTVSGSNYCKPFVCTCSTGSDHEKKTSSGQTRAIEENFNFYDFCEKFLWFMKKRRKSILVPIGALRFGVCRHRAVLMKYLCDRADPPIPCELVRGYLDCMPHAWNSILVKRGDAWMRLVVDACEPTDIREETDPEYFCRYIPMSRFHRPMTNDKLSILGNSFPLLSLCSVINQGPSGSVIHHCMVGTLEAVAKVRTLDTSNSSEEERKKFEHIFLGELRMLGALRKHACIVEIYGHRLSAEWIPPADGKEENQLLQSTIVMEYIKGGSLKNYIDKLSEEGEKHVPVGLALLIARDVACALLELHSKHIIHRDIKSQNILIDLDTERINGSPIVKLCDFDMAVPLHSFLHTCCIAHTGIAPPTACVGTPRWMAPEVLQSMHSQDPYGLEVDIWSYGCLLLELLTLKIPYSGLPESEVHQCIQMKQRPRLTAKLESLATELDSAPGTPGSDAEMLKLLVDLFYKCTQGNASDRPSAQHVYDVLCSALLPIPGPG